MHSVRSLLTPSVFFAPVLFFACATVKAPSIPLASNVRPRDSGVEARGLHYALATQGRAATQAAREVLAAGGSLIDATIAASFTISVERPQSTGLAGGGFLMYREAKTGQVYAIDFRERAPLAATAKMFLKSDGSPDPLLSREGILATGTPGIVAGMFAIHQRFGHLSWGRLLQPAIQLADQGFEIYPQLAKALKAREATLSHDPGARAIFLDDKGQAWPEGHRLIQKDLAKTLRLVAQNGRAGFYQGPVADQILRYFKSQRGLLQKKDLDQYRVHWREPVHSTFHGNDVYSMPPPSSGGVHVLQFLNILENDDLAQKGFLSVEAIHLEASALQSAFADRAKYLGDSDFVKVPVSELISKSYARIRRGEIPVSRARSADQVSPGRLLQPESSDTTHLSMVDEFGNMVSTTQTINGWMGSGRVVPGTGLVLNNEMDDFAAAPGASNLFGAIGSEANAVSPLKAPLSSMSPTLIVKDNQPVLAVGAPGGTRIISCVAETILNLMEFQLPLFESAASIRIHHQWRPDQLEIDPPGPSPEVLGKLKSMGYDVKLRPVGCDIMAVERDERTRELRAVADPRDIGTSAAN